MGTIDRACDQERQQQLAALLADMSLKLPTTFADTGPTRTPWPGQKQAPSKIDFIFCSSKLTTKLHNTDIPTPCTNTDHKPIGLTAHAPHASRKERRRQFEHLLGQKQSMTNIHTRWAPANEFTFAQKVRSLKFDNLSEVAEKLTQIAREETAYATEHSKHKRKLLEGVRTSKDPVIKKAYIIHLQAFRREKRVAQEQRRLMDSAKGKDWHFSKQAKMPGRAIVPQELDGEEDRGKWGHTLQQYLQTLYHADEPEASRIHEMLWKTHKRVHERPSGKISCNANELRDLIRRLPNHKAAGPDGAPSQLIKALTFKQIQKLADLFSTLANDHDFHSTHRPKQWDHALAILIPKHPHANTLDKHRNIALMNQLHKLYTKWILLLVAPTLDSTISENQLGFRRTRQPAEAIFALHRLTELSQEWEQPLTILRLDLSKAFDRMSQSAILSMLHDSPLSPALTFNIARELIGTHIQPHIYGITTDSPIKLARGAKQGAPESGMLFVSTLDWIMKPLLPHWEAQNYGVPIGAEQLTHLIFVDDLILVSPHPQSLLHMLRELRPRLQHIGLELNPAKTSYITTSPALATKLPGTNENDQGMRILGRIFRLKENTSQDIKAKIGTAWGKYTKIRHILKAPTDLAHRLRILQACVGQSLLWSCESWHITRRHLPDG